jgi:hypothetical protein
MFNRKLVIPFISTLHGKNIAAYDSSSINREWSREQEYATSGLSEMGNKKQNVQQQGFPRGHPP